MSIKSVGVQSPIVTRSANGHYEIVFGARRHAAAELAGLDKVPIINREYTDDERIVAMAIENLQREDLTVIDEAHQYQRLLDELKIPQRQLAERVGRSQAHISKRLALLKLPEKVQAQVDSGGIELTDAVHLAKLADDPKRVLAAINGPDWQSIEQRVTNELRQIERETKIAEAETAI